MAGRVISFISTLVLCLNAEGGVVASVSLVVRRGGMSHLDV